MTNQEMIYVDKVAYDARKRCCDEGIIDKEQCILEFEKLEQIINYFGGKIYTGRNLKKVTNGCNFAFKKNENSFDILTSKTLESSNVDFSLNILICIGYAFFCYDKLEIGNILSVDKRDHSKFDYPFPGCERADFFGRAFLMPRDLLEKSFIKSGCSCKGSEYFDIDDSIYTTRLREAKIII